jgi:hypothetical protein
MQQIEELKHRREVLKAAHNHVEAFDAAQSCNDILANAKMATKKCKRTF